MDHNRCKVEFSLLTFLPRRLDFTYYLSNSPRIPDLALSVETMDDGVCTKRRKQLYHNTTNTHTNFLCVILHECYGVDDHFVEVDNHHKNIQTKQQALS